MPTLSISANRPSPRHRTTARPSRAALIFLILVASLPFATRAQNFQVPDKPLGYVSDFANVLSSDGKAKLIALCTEVDQKAKAQIAVVTVPTADPAPTADGPFTHPHHAKTMGGPGNACGTPALILPTGLTDDGLPTALQLDGRAYSENRLLALASAYQDATKWHKAHPEIK